MTDEIIESAKAVQEVAKTTGQAISTVDRIGRFLSKVMNESIEAACGMVADTLKYKRWERQIGLIEKTERTIKDKKLTGRIRPVPPKLVLPIFHNASLEEDESLHDIWSNLLVTALDSSCEMPRTAFVDIICQLEPVDVNILNFIHASFYKQYSFGKKYFKEDIERRMEAAKKRLIEEREKVKKGSTESEEFKKRVRIYIEKVFSKYFEIHPWRYFCSKSSIIKEMGISTDINFNSIDNLIRQRLVSSYIDEGAIPPFDEESGEGYHVTYDYGNSKVCITSLGISFVEACTIEHKDINVNSST